MGSTTRPSTAWASQDLHGRIHQSSGAAGVDLHVKVGELLMLVGPSGAGRRPSSRCWPASWTTTEECLVSIRTCGHGAEPETRFRGANIDLSSRPSPPSHLTVTENGPCAPHHGSRGQRAREQASESWNRWAWGQAPHPALPSYPEGSSSGCDCQGPGARPEVDSCATSPPGAWMRTPVTSHESCAAGPVPRPGTDLVTHDNRIFNFADRNRPHGRWTES